MKIANITRLLRREFAAAAFSLQGPDMAHAATHEVMIEAVRNKYVQIGLKRQGRSQLRGFSISRCNNGWML